MASLSRNVAANFAGTAWIVALQLAVVPVCVGLIGVEAWGVIAFFASLQAVLALLDLGLGATISRELARLGAQPDGAHAMRDTLRTLEIVYWLTGAAIGIACWTLAPWFATSWLRPSGLSIESTTAGLRWLGIALALRWPNTLYWGGLSGLERQGLLNLQRVLTETLRHGGSVVVLWGVAAELEAYAAWHCIAGVVSSVSAGVLLRWCLPARGVSGKFSSERLRTVWRFAAGVGIVSGLGVLLSQMDKLVLSRFLPLSVFGHYGIAATVAGGLGLLAGPIHQAFFPRLVRHLAAGDVVALTADYHLGCRLAALALAPAAASGILFAEPWLAAWLRDAVLAREVAPLFAVLLGGTFLNGLMSLPWALQLASGWTALAVRINALALAVSVPALVLSVNYGGALGAASVWFALNLFYVLVGMHLMHLRLLPREKWRWYAIDVVLPIGVAFASAGSVRIFSDSIVGAVCALTLSLLVTATVLIGSGFLPSTRSLLHKSGAV